MIAPISITAKETNAPARKKTETNIRNAPIFRVKESSQARAPVLTRIETPIKDIPKNKPKAEINEVFNEKAITPSRRAAIPPRSKIPPNLSSRKEPTRSQSILIQSTAPLPLSRMASDVKNVDKINPKTFPSDRIPQYSVANRDYLSLSEQRSM
jgi:hypothetical protein